MSKQNVKKLDLTDFEKRQQELLNLRKEIEMQIQDICKYLEADDPLLELVPPDFLERLDPRREAAEKEAREDYYKEHGRYPEEDNIQIDVVF